MPYIAFYGSLMQAFATQSRLKIQHQLALEQTCTIYGTLYDLGAYPGLVYGAGIVQAELYTILDPRVLATLDAFEGYDSAQPHKSLYTRSCVRLASPNVDAWVYFYNQTTELKTMINSGDWLQFHTQKTQSTD